MFKRSCYFIPTLACKLSCSVTSSLLFLTITGTELDNQWEQLTKYGTLHEKLLVHIMLMKFHHDYPTEVCITKKQVVDILLCFHLVAPITKEVWFAELGYPPIPESGDTFIVPVFGTSW